MLFISFYNIYKYITIFIKVQETILYQYSKTTIINCNYFYYIVINLFVMLFINFRNMKDILKCINMFIIQLSNFYYYTHF